MNKKKMKGKLVADLKFMFNLCLDGKLYTLTTNLVACAMNE